MSFQKIDKTLRAQTDFKISWRRWTGINSIFCWWVKRGEDEENFLTANGHRFFLSGGSIGRPGVGIVVGRSLYQRMSNVVFHAYSDRLCSFHFTLENVSFQVFSCYMPTSWEPYHEVEELSLSNCERVGASAVVGGDFNAMLGDCWEADDRDVLGTRGFGERNDRGWCKADWIHTSVLRTIGLAAAQWTES